MSPTSPPSLGDELDVRVGQVKVKKDVCSSESEVVCKKEDVGETGFSELERRRSLLTGFKEPGLETDLFRNEEAQKFKSKSSQGLKVDGVK